MSHYAVIREAGPGWIEDGIAAQPEMADHASFMHTLADEGFVLFAGPLAGTENGRLRALLIMNADSEDEIRHCLADDPLDAHGPARDHKHRALEPHRRGGAALRVRKPRAAPALPSVSLQRPALTQPSLPVSRASRRLR